MIKTQKILFLSAALFAVILAVGYMFFSTEFFSFKRDPVEIGKYIDHGDGTITDNLTGLMWKKCTEGLTGYECDFGGAKKITWQEAFATIKSINEKGGFAGYTDWRIPSIAELTTMLDFEFDLPVINTNVFPANPCCKTREGKVPWFEGEISSMIITPALYWSSSLNATNCFPWIMYINSGKSKVAKKDPKTVCGDPHIYLRLVRGAPLKPSFTINSNGTVLDAATGLQWKKCLEGVTGLDCDKGEPIEMSYQDAMKYSSDYNRSGFGGYQDWRLPTMHEYLSLIDFERDGTIPENLFHENNTVWTSTRYKGNPQQAAWIAHRYFYQTIDFQYDDGLTKYKLRLVRTAN